MDKFRHINDWVFDLDNTLYDADTHLFTEISRLMSEYVAKHLKISHEEATKKRDYFYKTYGTTLRGMMTEHSVDPEHFLDYVHDVDIKKVPPCPVTQEGLSLLPGRKTVFTNAPRGFAEDMLKHLGIDHHFESVFGIDDADYIPKPNAEAYHVFLAKHGIDPLAACMFEDTDVNLKTAHDLGMTTVWFHGKDQDHHTPDRPYVHHKAEKLVDWLTSTVKRK